MKKEVVIMIFFMIVLFVSCKKNSSIDPNNNYSDSINNNSRPNIIFIIADDLGWDAFGNYPNITSTKAITPTLDSLARNGITFTNYWVTPLCTPTRAALLTGRYAFRTGVGGINPALDYLHSTETIIHKYLTDHTGNAYATALIGKWHVTGPTDLSAPENFGIQYFLGYTGGEVSDYYNWTQVSGGAQQNITTYATTYFVNKSIDWIQQQIKPFFLWLAFNAPHMPFHRPPLNLISDQSLVSDTAVINLNPLPYYLAAIEAMDKEIARLIASLTPEQKSNTIFVFMGDNGTPTQVAQRPFLLGRAKGYLYQGGINTPLIIAGKNVARVGQTDTSLVNTTDMFSTIADMAGTGVSVYEDGKSIKPLLSSSQANFNNYVYTEQFDNIPGNADGYAIRNVSYKLIHLDNGTEYFYHITTDPFERTNLLLNALSAEADQNLSQLRLYKSQL